MLRTDVGNVLLLNILADGLESELNILPVGKVELVVVWKLNNGLEASAGVAVEEEIEVDTELFMAEVGLTVAVENKDGLDWKASKPANGLKILGADDEDSVGVCALLFIKLAKVGVVETLDESDCWEDLTKFEKKLLDVSDFSSGNEVVTGWSAFLLRSAPNLNEGAIFVGVVKFEEPKIFILGSSVAIGLVESVPGVVFELPNLNKLGVVIVCGEFESFSANFIVVFVSLGLNKKLFVLVKEIGFNCCVCPLIREANFFDESMRFLSFSASRSLSSSLSFSLSAWFFSSMLLCIYVN